MGKVGRLVNRIRAEENPDSGIENTAVHVGELEVIVDAALARSAESRGEAVAEVRSAVALTEDQLSRLAAALKAKTHRDVAVRNIVDPSVVGGIVTQIGDALFDGSVRTRLTQLRDAF